MTKLEKQIESAAKLCRAAFAKYPNAKWSWCCHHEKWFEELTEPAESRIVFILRNKSKSEQMFRLNNFRPVRDEKKFQPAWAKCEKVRQTALAEYEKVRQTVSKPLKKIYKKDVPLGTWNGQSIFNE